MPKPVLLLAFADDRHDASRSLLMLEKERRAIHKALRWGEREGCWEVVVRQNASLQDILDVFYDPGYRNRIALLHFSGHANSYGLLLESEAACSPQLAGADGFAGFLGQQRGLEAVVLNGCYTIKQVRALLDAGVRAVIATSGAIRDDIASRFGAYLYKGLGAGDSIGVAYVKAAEAIKAKFRNADRTWRIAVPAGDDDIDGAHDDGWPWKLALRPGHESAAEWSLGRAAGDPTWGLPPLPAADLPLDPYRHLQPFEAQHARVFFGRGQEIRTLYDAVTGPETPPIIVLAGPSGAGKSSLLAAGLLPRLDAEHSTVLRRATGASGLRSSLLDALNVAPSLAASPLPTLAPTAWSASEALTDRPLIVVLDQVDSAFSHDGCEGLEDLDRLLADLAGIFLDRRTRPRGRMVLGIRKEWYLDLEARLKSVGLPFRTVFIQRLDHARVVEAITGPVRDNALRAQYRLTIEDGLPEYIASTLLADPSSPVAPMLQILLATLWDRATKLGDTDRVIDRALFNELRAVGLGLDDFLGRALSAAETTQPDDAASGLALDLLGFFVSELSTARARSPAELRHEYRHVSNAVSGLVRVFVDLHVFLLERDRRSSEHSVRLAHDTLAPLVLRRIERSELPGQRAQRIVRAAEAIWRDGSIGRPLAEHDYAVVRVGRFGTRRFAADARRMIRASRFEAERQRARRLVQFAANASREDLQQVLFRLSRGFEPEGGVQLARKLAEGGYPFFVLPCAEQQVSHAAFSARGDQVAVGSRDGTVCIWRANGAGTPDMLEGHNGRIHALAYSSDGRHLLTASDDLTARLWKTPFDGPPRILVGHDGPIRCAAFSADGKRIVTTSDDGTVRVWSVDGPDDPRILLGHEGDVMWAAFDADGTRVVSASGDCTARVWHLDEERDVVVLDGHDAPVVAACFSPDGHSVVTASDDMTARLWRVDARGEVVVFAGHEGEVTSVCFDGVGSRILTGSGDGTARVWRIDSPDDPVVLEGHARGVNRAVFSPDGRHVATASDDRTARVWKSDGTGEPIVFGEHDRGVRTVAYSPDGRWIVTAAEDETARVSRADFCVEPVVLDAPGGYLQGASFNHDGTRVLTATTDGKARVWNADGLGAPIILEGHSLPLRGAAFSPDGSRVVTGSEDRTARVWNTEGGKAIAVLQGHERTVRRVRFSRDGARVFTWSDDGTLRLWPADGRGQHIICYSNDERQRCVAISPDGRLFATTSESGHVSVARTDAVGTQLVLAAEGSRPNDATFNADGSRLVVGFDDGSARVWRTDRADAPLVLSGHQRSVLRAHFSPDSRLVVTTSSDHTARVWRLDRPAEPVELRGHQGRVWTAAISHDSRRVVTSSDDGTARVWRTDGSDEPVILEGHLSEVTSARFSPDGTRVVTGSDDGTARVWRVEWNSLLRYLGVVLEK